MKEFGEFLNEFSGKNIVYFKRKVVAINNECVKPYLRLAGATSFLVTACCSVVCGQPGNDAQPCHGCGGAINFVVQPFGCRGSISFGAR